MKRRGALLFILPLAAACSGGAPQVAGPGAATTPAPAARVEVSKNGWPPSKQARHALNRLAYGPAPGDVERVSRQGVAEWIREQMDPGRIDDGDVDAKLASLPTLSMSIARLHEAYPRPQTFATKAGIAKNDPALRTKIRGLLDPKRRPAEIERQLTTAKLVRAIESRRQLEEVLADFWFNHFNVFAAKSEDRWMVTAYDRDAIRPFVFGRFRDLLGATAKHPAMLWYLDNWSSVRDGLGRRGLNENYARELLELHTLGVDGGYVQNDVREVARCFTGWSIVRPRGLEPNLLARLDEGRTPGTFVFRPFAHDSDSKVVLGRAIPPGGGQADGEAVLDLLAASPSTAQLLAKKLCRRFVADEPPPALVDRVAAVYLRANGDLPSVYAAIFSSREFWSDSAYGAKTKTPLDLAASAVRALGGSVRPTGVAGLAREIARMGQPLYLCAPPTGYQETADAWVNAGALLSRLNFAVALAGGKVRGVVLPPEALAAATSNAALLGSPDFQKR